MSSQAICQLNKSNFVAYLSSYEIQFDKLRFKHKNLSKDTHLLSETCFSTGFACATALGGGGSSILARVACIACSMVDKGLLGLAGSVLESVLASPAPL